MDSGRPGRGALLALVMGGAMLWSAGPVLAAPFAEFVDPNPAAGNQFGAAVVPLSTGNVVITSPFDDAGGTDAGAVYLFNGSTGALISTLRGSTAGDNVGISGVTALSNGNYVVRSHLWDNGAIVDAGAATWGSGTSGVSGEVSAANSLIGSTAADNVGSSGVTVLSNGNYVVQSPSWDNGAATDAGAVTWGSGTSGVSGVVSAANSLVGTTADTNLQPIVVDNVNYTFIGRFLAEGGGRVRVDAQYIVVIVSAVDIPNDQGGWLRLTFNRFALDAANASPPLATYGVWRHVPGTLVAGAGRGIASARSARVEAPGIERMRTAVPAGLDVWEVEGQLYVTGTGPRAAGIATLFPPGPGSWWRASRRCSRPSTWSRSRPSPMRRRTTSW